MSKRIAFSLRPIGFEDLADVRHLHTTAFRAAACAQLDQEQVDALVEHIESSSYSDQVLGANCVGAWIDRTLCGTAGWSPGGQSGHGARVLGVFVSPLFKGLGVGRSVVDAAEARAHRAGFSVLSVRSPLITAGFFERLGYSGTSQGVWTTPAGIGVPVRYLRKNAAPVSEIRFPSDRAALLQLTGRVPARVH
jgi:GNAT superfamily N-acetyltransferase